MPQLPVKHEDFITYVAENVQRPMVDLITPYKEYDSKLREIYAQQPDHPSIAIPNMVPLYQGHEHTIKIRARALDTETEKERQRYLMPLDAADRKVQGSAAIVSSLKAFQTNFSIFSESALADLDWSNVVVAGSAALTPLLPVPAEHAETKRSLRRYYHEMIAPASDVDLFLYDLTEEEAVEKIKQIEKSIRDSILTETTTIRTKNTITVVSQYPTRHVQIVLRIYRSISEILTGFDVDCSCIAYNGKQVFASPRALAACMTQTNTIDLSRRSPSYENRLSKYSHRGFEIYWPELDRSLVDPTIFERSFRRVVGLARLLVLEKLPTSGERDAYTDQRRKERGRPAIDRWQYNHSFGGNLKDQHEDEVADWVEEEDVSNYHTFVIPYGPKYNARKIEKLIYKKDLLLNAEWNKPADREVNLHRHPAFFGSAADVMSDCCGYCPKPVTPEERQVIEVESKNFISGEVAFLKDDPGRQAIGSFHPLTKEDWTEMAYVGHTDALCNAIIEHDLEMVLDWFSQEGADPNRRDHTGRVPLHLAVMCSSIEIVQCIIDHGARIVARLVDGKTALHLAAIRGNADIVAALLRKSEANAEAEEKKKSSYTNVEEMPGASQLMPMEPDSGSFIITADDKAVEEVSDDDKCTSEPSYVKVMPNTNTQGEVLDDALDDDPDIYDVDVVAWDVPVSALHLAVVKGHTGVVRVLISDFGANPLLPVKLNDRGAILTLELALYLPIEKSKEMTRALLNLGSTAAQSDLKQITALHSFSTSNDDLLRELFQANVPIAESVLNHVALSGWQYNPGIATPLLSAVVQDNKAMVACLLQLGANPSVSFSKYWESYKKQYEVNHSTSPQQHKTTFEVSFRQPIIAAIDCDSTSIVSLLLAHGADVNTITPDGHRAISEDEVRPRVHGQTLLDLIREKVEALHRSATDAATVLEEPQKLQEDDDVYLKDYQADTYAFFAVSEQIRRAKDEYRAKKQAWDRARQEQEILPKGINEKRAALRDLILEYEQLELHILDRGAKTFRELYPDAKEPHNYARYTDNSKPVKPTPWKPSLIFRDKDAVDDKSEACRDLFEACWVGDLDKIKAYTLAPWAKSDTNFPPLRVTIFDEAGFTPFFICVIRGHRKVAETILEIARIQYSPRERDTTTRYFLDLDGLDNGEDPDDCNSIEIRSEVLDERFTIDNIGEVHLQVQSHVKPLHHLGNAYPSSPEIESMLLSARSGKTSDVSRPQGCGPPRNLFQLAVYVDDFDLFCFLFVVADDHASRRLPGDTSATSNFFEFAPENMSYIINSDRTKFLAEAIRWTGAGISLDALVKKSGVDITNAPLYYQGLSVGGKKRADWAQAEKGYDSQHFHNSHPPLLEAGLRGRLSCVKWLQSDDAKTCYALFMRTNIDDARLKNLAQSEGGLEISVERWLSHNRHLLMHCVVLGNTNHESLELLQYLIEEQPALMQAKSLSGQTPLHLAFSLHRHSMCKVLISAGSDQECRDKRGNNIVHAALVPNNDRERTNPDNVRELLSLINPEIYPGLATERSFADPGFTTPLARWLYLQYRYFSSADMPREKQRNMTELVQMLFQFSKGAELEVINGEGDTPLHSAVKCRNASLVRVMLEWKPELLFRENATGSTPYELAQDADLAEIFAGKPLAPGLRLTTTWERQRATKERFVDQKPIAVALVDRAPASFLLDDSKDDRTTDCERVWHECQNFEMKAQEQTPGTKMRKLVSLLEANEVAKRLATRERTKAKKRRFSVEDDAQEAVEKATDEVEQWYTLADSQASTS